MSEVISLEISISDIRLLLANQFQPVIEMLKPDVQYELKAYATNRAIVFAWVEHEDSAPVPLSVEPSHPPLPRKTIKLAEPLPALAKQGL